MSLIQAQPELSHPSMTSADFLPDYQFNQLTRDQGLSQTTIYSINQDASGFIWLASQEGLNRFDGRKVKSFFKSGKPYSLTDSYIYTVENDPADPLFMWLGTHGGLFRYHHPSGQFEQFSGQPDSPISDDKIYRILFENQQFAWIATEKGLNYYDTSNNINRTFLLSHASVAPDRLNAIYSISPLSHQRLLLGTRAGLFVFDKALEQVIYQLSLAENTTVWSLLEDHNQTIWVGTSDGLYYLSAQSRIKMMEEVIPADLAVQKQEFTAGASVQNVYSLFQARNHDLWFGSGDGVFLKSSQSEKLIHLQNQSARPTSLVNNTVWSIFEDSGGVLWFGTDAGVSYFDPRSQRFQLLTTQTTFDGLADPWVLSVYKQEEGPLWVGNNLGIEAYLRGKKIYHFDQTAGLSNAWAYSFFQQNETLLWVGTYSGLNLVDLASKSVSQDIPGFAQGYFAGKNIWQLMKDSLGHLWIGTDAGLDKINLETGQTDNYVFDSNSPVSLSENRVYSLHEDRIGQVWVGTSGGLNLYHPDSNDFSRYLARNGEKGDLNSDWITDVVSDQYNRLWVATDAGLNVMDIGSNEFAQIPAIPGLNEYIYTLEVDEKGKLWFTSTDSIGLLDYRGDLAKPLDFSLLKLTRYRKGQGIQPGDFNFFASWKDQAGALYFGGAQGLNRVEPASFNLAERRPTPLITELEVNGKMIKPDWQDPASPLHHQISWESDLLLTHDQNFITIYLAALDFSSPSDNRIEYRIVGLDDGWKATTDGQPFITLYKVNPGDYRLEVRAATANGDWNLKAASLRLIIQPPWWLSQIAQVIYSLMAIMLVLSIYWVSRLRVKRLKALVSREQAAARQLKEIDKLKDQFLANTSHELRTPLNAIIGLSDYLLISDLDGIEKHELLDNISLIHASGTRMHELVEDLLQYSSLRAGKQKITPVSFNIAKLIEVALKVSAAAHPKKSARLTLNNRVEDQGILVWADPDRVKQILLNLLGNAIKFTPQGEVTVEMVESEHQVEISVIDTGVGIAPSDLAHIFEPFVQAGDHLTRSSEGFGLGLGIVKQLVELQGGRISIGSQVNQGTRIGFTLPKFRQDQQEA